MLRPPRARPLAGAFSCPAPDGPHLPAARVLGKCAARPPRGPVRCAQPHGQSGCASTRAAAPHPSNREQNAIATIVVTLHDPPKAAVAGLKKHGLKADKSAAENGGLVVLLDDLADVEAFARFATDNPDGLNVTYDTGPA